MSSALPDKLTLVCTSTEATTTSKNNSNKFHKWEKQPNGDYLHTYGRVGDPGVSHTVSASKMQAKMKDALRNGYKEVNIAGSEPVTSAPKSSATAKTAVEEIAKGDPVITKLVEFLSAQNVHNISQSTTLKYDAASGLFSTPLGIVSQDSIDEAREVLARAQKIVDDKHWASTVNEKNKNAIAADFMMLIPTDIGRDRPTFDRMFPDLDAIQKQNDILESLEGSLAMAAKQVVSKKTKVVTPRVWDITLRKMDDKAEIERIRTKFRKTHESGRSHFDVRNVYDVTINHMKKSFDAVGRKLGNIEEMWHGTSVGNVLSIFAKGLIIPSQCSNGRNFGNGVYASRQSHKSLQYAGTFRSATRSSCYMFLVEVAMGKNFIPKSHVRNPPAGYDSMDVVPGSAGGWPHHEAIVYKTAQTNVVRLIEFAA